MPKGAFSKVMQEIGPEIRFPQGLVEGTISGGPEGWADVRIVLLQMELLLLGF